jgi:D-alanyl-D-alanine carboxypeptidase
VLELKEISSIKLDEIIKQATAKKFIQGAVFNVLTGDGSQSWCGAAGNLNVDSRYYIASINKLFIAAVVLKLISKGKLTFGDFFAKYVPEDLIAGLHVYQGKDYSNNITIEHLLSLTSGLPCYLSDKPKNGRSIMSDLEAGIDQACSTERVVELVKSMQPHFIPGDANKCKYIDTGHQLLNLVIEKITGMPVEHVLNSLFAELNMTNTYVCENVDDKSYVFPYYKNEERNISKFITSTQNDIISTAQDQMLFIRAFFNGYFYPKEQLKSLEKWNKIFFPFQYGVGIQKFYMPRLLSPFRAVPDMIGHCGSTGTVAYYVPDVDIYITGTTNQQANPGAAFQTMIKIIHACS